MGKLGQGDLVGKLGQGVLGRRGHLPPPPPSAPPAVSPDQPCGWKKVDKRHPCIIDHTWIENNVLSNCKALTHSRQLSHHLPD